jgi:uncharacterized protein (TIGR03086 family)
MAVDDEDTTTHVPPIEMLERAFAATCAEVDATAPEQLALPTPCADWDVRALVNHIIGGAYWYAEAMRDGVSPPLDGGDDDHAAGDFRAEYAAGIRQALDAFGAPGALHGSVEFVGRPLPATTVLRLASLDTFVHGWDLAGALGRSTDLDPEIADELRERAVPRLPASFRGTTPDALYRPPADVPAGATAADRLAAALGRDLG